MKKKLSELLVYEQPTKYIVKTENYSDEYVTPVLTAGKTFVLGHTNETEGIFKGSKEPVIIFDDFTRDTKYVDFDFKVKSSAMKILHKRNKEDSLKYLHYAINNIKYTPFSHKRLWISDFSNFEIEYPASEKQQEIVKSLDTIQHAIDSKKMQTSLLNEAVKSRFFDMFGDPVQNPMSWEVRKLKETTNIITGNTPSRKEKDNYGTFIEWIKTDNITEKTYITTATEYLSEKGEKNGRTVEAGSILMACIAGSLRSIGRVALTDRKVAFNQQINAIVPIEYNNFFLYTLFQNTQSYAQSTVNMALKGILSKGKLEELEYIVPPMDIQNDFAAFVQKIDKSKLVIKQQITDLQELLDSKMQEYFS